MGGARGDPWTTIVTQAIAAEAVLAQPVPGGPGMFRCAAPGYVSALYEAAGLRDVAEWDVGVELVTDSPAQYWEMISEHVSLAAAALAQASGPGAGADRGSRHRQGQRLEEDGKVGIPAWPAASSARVGTPEPGDLHRRSKRLERPKVYRNRQRHFSPGLPGSGARSFVA